MILRQLFDYDSYTYTYLLGDELTRKAVLIDPVETHTDDYLVLLKELELQLAYAMDTHVHADHITALGALRDKTDCQTYIGNPGEIACADNSLNDGQVITIGDINIRAIYTPGHTDDSYCFYVIEGEKKYLFTGDTLLIRGSGRTDFQNGNAADLYHSLHERILILPEETIVYPAHDYKGWTSSTIGEEKRHNPRVKIANETQFIMHMSTLDLPNPKLMDVAVPANRSCGKVM